MNNTLDKIDKLILNKLQLNARITNSQLAKDIGLSPAPTLERVKKLEQSGYILGYHTQLSRKQLGLEVSIYLQASLKASGRKLMENCTKKKKKITEVVECHHVTGSADFLLKILTKDIESYNRFVLEQLIDIDEIGNLQSMVVLSTIKNSKSLPI